MYGRTGELEKLNRDRNDVRLTRFVRLQADRAHAKIVAQLGDKGLMRLRERLMNAVRAGDQDEARKIEIAMRVYSKQDRETGT